MPTIPSTSSPSAAATRSSPPSRERDQDESCVDELAEVPCDEPEERLELELGHERVADLVQRLELPQPARRALVEPRVLDRDRCLRGEELGQLGVVLREPCAAILLGEVEVAVRNPPQQDRHAEERAHRRVLRREADRARVVGDVLEPQRVCVPDQDAEDAPAERRVTDAGPRLLVDADGEEALEGGAGAVDHSERRVAGTGQRRGRLDDPLQQCVERELRAQRDARVDEDVQPVGEGGARHRGPFSRSRPPKRDHEKCRTPRLRRATGFDGNDPITSPERCQARTVRGPSRAAARRGHTFPAPAGCPPRSSRRGPRRGPSGHRGRIRWPAARRHGRRRRSRRSAGRRA